MLTSNFYGSKFLSDSDTFVTSSVAWFEVDGFRFLSMNENVSGLYNKQRIFTITLYGVCLYEGKILALAMPESPLYVTL